MARGSEDENKKGSDGDSAEGIANPPGEPDGAKMSQTPMVALMVEARKPARQTKRKTSLVL